jgi:hypothetical protein
MILFDQSLTQQIASIPVLLNVLILALKVVFCFSPHV